MHVPQIRNGRGQGGSRMVDLATAAAVFGVKSSRFSGWSRPVGLEGEGISGGGSKLKAGQRLSDERGATKRTVEDNQLDKADDKGEKLLVR